MEALKVPLAEIASNHAPDLSFENRPGVPMEAAHPRSLPGAHWRKPEKQQSRAKVFTRVGLEELTPVYGSAQPPRGLSGLIKAMAYKKAESDPNHWALLLFSDRIDVLESRLPVVGLVVGALAVGAWAISRVVKRNP